MFNNYTMDSMENVSYNDTSVSPFPSALYIFQSLLFSIVCLVGLIGNTLVIYVVLRFSKMQTVTNMYIVNLAIADECFLIGIPFLIVTMVKHQWIFGQAVCKAYMITTSINQYTSSIFICIMSADRYIAVCHPISSPRWRTPMISKIVSCLAWMCSIVLMMPIIEHAEEVDNVLNMKSCVINWQIGENLTQDIEDGEPRMNSALIFTVYTFVFSFFIPLVAILVFYLLVIQKLKTVGPKNRSKEKKRSHRKVTNLVLTVVTVYVICWLPYWAAQLAIRYYESDNFQIALHLLTSCLSYSNSAINPILYAFLSDNFKKSFLKACTCAAHKEINATLHMENSVFPRKNKQSSVRLRPTRCTSICRNQEEECDAGMLVSKNDASTSAITMTSRTNITSLSDSREGLSKNTLMKNGVAVTKQPTCL